MKNYNRPRKIRVIMKSNQGIAPVYGVVLPPNLEHWLGVHVTVQEDGDKIILHSGALPSIMPKSKFTVSYKKEDVVYL